jgi:hypothetical protein|tara:strand:+ start:89 stop:328 length:240 start_codon:yes stop_codon:yes gene_type:complete
MTREEQRDNTITELYKNRTSPNTLAIQASKTARSKAEWFWISTGDEGKGTYDVGRRTMKRERLVDKKLRAKQSKSARLS